MILVDTYAEFSPEIMEMVSVKSAEPFWSCPDGCVAWVPGEVCMDQYRLQIQRRIEEWVLKNVGCFEELSSLCYTRRQTLAYIRKRSKSVECDDRRFSPRVIRNVLDWFCFHVRICGQKFYLKKSVKKYCETGNGWFPLSEGL